MRLLVSLVVLALLAVGVDRGGDLVAENIVASRLQDEQHLTSKPSVDIEGFPFLDQFAKGRYDHVRVRATKVPVQGSDLTVSSLTVDFRDVVTNRDFTHFTAARATASAVVGYDALGQALGIDASYAGNGRVTVSKSFDVLGQTIRPKATVEATYSRGSLTLGDLDLGDDVPSEVADLVRSAIDDSLSLDDLPFDATVRSVRATDRGLVLRLRGTDLTYDS